MLAHVFIDSVNVLLADIRVSLHPEQVALDHLKSAFLLKVLLGAFIIFEHTLLSIVMAIKYTKISGLFDFQRDEELADIGTNLGYALI